MAKRRRGDWKCSAEEFRRFKLVWVALCSCTEPDGRAFVGTLGLLSILSGLHVTTIRGVLKRMAAAGIVADPIPSVPIQPWVQFHVNLGRSPAEATGRR